MALTIQGKQVSMRQLFARFSEVSAPGKPLRPVLGGHGAWYFALRRQVESKLLHRALAGSARRPARHLGFTVFTLEAELKDTTSRPPLLWLSLVGPRIDSKRFALVLAWQE